MEYKGYIRHVEYDDEAKIFHGEVVGLRDIITFQGKSVEDLEQAFKGSIDDYLSWCKESGWVGLTDEQLSILEKEKLGK